MHPDDQTPATPNDPPAETTPTDDAPATPLTEREADEKKLAELEVEYAELKTAVADSALKRTVDGIKLARKGEVFAAITAIKRKYRLP